MRFPAIDYTKGKATYCDCVTMTEERLDLLLVMDVPHSDYSVLSSRDHELAVGRDSMACDFVEMTVDLAVELFTSEKQLFL